MGWEEEARHVGRSILKSAALTITLSLAWIAGAVVLDMHILVSVVGGTAVFLLTAFVTMIYFLQHD